MRAALLLPEPFAALYRDALQYVIHPHSVERLSDIEDPSAIDYLLVGQAPGDSLRALTGLKAIIAVGAGVDQILQGPALAGVPSDVPVIRLPQPDLKMRMTEYVTWRVLAHHRQARAFAAQQREGRWAFILPQPAASERSVGVMGLGELGRDACDALLRLGFRVRGWSRTRKTLPDVETFAGREELGAFLAETEIVVLLLPLTAQTRHVLDRDALQRLPEGAAVINAGRGGLVDETALLEALEAGRVAEASLDVFEHEPLPPDHPFWTHPRVFITPHCASAAMPEPVGHALLRVIEDVESGRPPAHAVDRKRGY